MTDPEITTAARRIAKAINAYRGSRMTGKLVFGLDGKGGQWYAESHYDFGPDVLVFSCGGREPITARQVQDILDRDSLDA